MNTGIAFLLACAVVGMFGVITLVIKTEINRAKYPH